VEKIMGKHMRISSITGFLIIFTVTVGLSANAEQKTKLDARDFVVADISIGMSRAKKLL
jgi:hypothetical protein